MVLTVSTAVLLLSLLGS